jgi:hypothetical protein
MRECSTANPFDAPLKEAIQVDYTFTQGAGKLPEPKGYNSDCCLGAIAVCISKERLPVERNTL